jgi:hypothetical protein
MLRQLAINAMVFVAVGLSLAAAQPSAPERESAEALPPRSGSTWEPGHWHWNGDRHVWIGGHWSAGGSRYGHYVQGHWGWSDGRWAWRPAHWE